MPYRFKITDVDENNTDDERYNDPSEREDYDDYLEDDWNTQHQTDCHSCSGTGIGNGSGHGCVWCGGKGFIIRKH